MSLRPDHVEAARLGLGHGLFARLATRSRRKLVPTRADWASMSRGGVMLERNGLAVQPGAGQMGNVGKQDFPPAPL